MTDGLRKQIEALVARLLNKRDAKLDDRINALIDARLQEVMAEMQSQVDTIIDGGGA